MSFLVDLIASYLVRGLNILFHFLPMSFNLWLGRNIGSVIYYLNAKRARIAYANLKAAFCKEKSPEELKRITKDAYKNMAETFLEILCMTKVDKRYIDKYVTIHNLERVERASKNPKGMILLSAHFGNWELSLVASSIKGFPLHIIARDQKMERVYELFNKLRESKGSIVIRKGASVKAVFRVLHDGGGVGILGDQNAGADGELIDLFGRPASTAVGPCRFAQKTGAWILPAFIRRVKGPYHDLMLEEPMMIGKDEDILPYMQEYNRLLEKHVRAHPDQWLWMHKKWKMTPIRKILVLDDGKKGHLKQSLAVVAQIRRYREDEGYSSADTQVDIVPVRFKSKTARVLLNLGAIFVPHHRFAMTFLALVLDKKSYEEVSRKYADVVLSCGSGLVGVNRMLKIENNAKNVTVLDPGPMMRRGFNLIVAPRHDTFKRRLKGDNVVVTELAPNLITAYGPRLRREASPRQADEKPCIGVLFGGDNKYFSFSNRLTQLLAEGILEAHKRLDAKFYLTTSRRTSENAELILKDALRARPECMGFVFGKTDKDERTVEKILEASDVVIVSGESISMVSEAVSSGRPVIVFMPEKRIKRATKYEGFVTGLCEKGYIKYAECAKIPDVVENALRQRHEVNVPDDNKRIYEKLYRLF